MEIELFQDAGDHTGAFAALVNPIEGIMCGFHRQCWNIQYLAVRRDGGDPGCDEEADIAQPAELLYHIVYLLSARSMRIEYGFGVVEDYEHVFG